MIYINIYHPVNEVNMLKSTHGHHSYFQLNGCFGNDCTSHPGISWNNHTSRSAYHLALALERQVGHDPTQETIPNITINGFFIQSCPNNRFIWLTTGITSPMKP